MRRNALFPLALIAALLVTQAVRAETLTDDAVVQLSKAGLSPQTIVAKIQTTPNQFDVSTGALVWLKRQAVADDVIAAMVTAANGGAPGSASYQSDSADPLAPHAAGLYLLQASAAPPTMQRLDPTVADDVKATSALAWILSSGIVPLKVTAVVDGPTARLKADTRPAFYLYFNQPGSGFYQHGLGWLRLPGPTPTPDLFTLVRFQTVDGNRQLLTQRIRGALSGPGDVTDTHVAFRYTAVSPGVFEVTPQAALDPGEYAFVYTPQDAGEGDDTQPRYFDFSVPG